ncbi:MAG: HD domain-containing protein [Lachnospiraceae bacterium]|jgi:(p)ppGpp synthase/HD superfamily hydrolase|nr:HD domain-containing protein [Lachnospiraceae bacterium]MEE3460609.1 HD domain-containing protein [Lachnospiraceae bacterium]
MDLHYDDYFTENDLVQIISRYSLANGFTETPRALSFAVEKHQGQKRREGTPYIVHPLTVAVHAASLGIAEDEVIAACILHDVCEDCGVALEDLPVNDTVREAVSRLTFVKVQGIPRYEQKKNYFLKMRDNRIACIVKILDRCNNVSTMARGFSDDRLKRYIKETEDFVFPLLDYVEITWKSYKYLVFSVRYHILSVLSTIIICKNP